MFSQFLLHIMAVLPYAPKSATNQTSRVTLCIWLMLILLNYKIQLRSHSPAISYFTALVSADINFYRITFFTALVSADINFYRITYFIVLVCADINF